MFKKRHSWTLRPYKSSQYQNDQLPFLSQGRFRTIPKFAAKTESEPENLSLFIAILYVIDLFGVFPFVTFPALLVQLGVVGIPLIILVVALQIYTSFLLSQCWHRAESLDPSINQKKKFVN